MMNIFEKIFRELNKARVKYLVVGGVAVNLHGYLRFTGDLDLLLLLNKKNLAAADHVMKKLYYCQRLPVALVSLSDAAQVKKWMRTKNLTAYTYSPQKENALQVDIVVNESLKFSDYDKRKTIQEINKIRIPVVAISDIINMKKKAGRDKDMADLRVLDYLSKL